MSSALEIIYGVRAMAPQADPFAIIVNQIEIKLSPDMGSSYIPALRALHVIFALQAVLLVLSLVIRYRRSRGDMWIFRLRSTARGTVVLPHFAVAWQLWMLLFLVILQPYLVMEADHSMRKNWKGYIIGRTMGFLPAWQAVWSALWSLTVAVTLPRAGASSRQSANFLSAPWFLNAHFIGLAIACCIAIGVPSIMSGIHFDRAVVHFEACTSVYRALSSSYPSMTEDEVMTGLLSQSNELQGILDEFNLFGPLFSYAWSCWLAFILYAYSVFLVVSVFYFSYLRRSMNKIKNLEGKSLERKALQKTWWFAVLTSALVTMTGLAYAGAALFMTVNLDAAIGTATGLRVITFLSLYSEAGLGLIAAILSLAQTLVGSQKATLGSGSNTGATGGRYIGGKSTGLGGVGTTAGGVSVSIATRTHIESDSAVVQLELADWAEKDGMDETSEKRLQYSNPL